MRDASISARVKYRWKRMLGHWGSQLTEKFGAVPPEDWTRLLDHITDDQFNRTLALCRHEYLQYPPNLGQFEMKLRTPVARAINPQDVINRLTDYVHKHYRERLSPRQLSLSWHYISAPAVEIDEAGNEVNVRRIVGVSIPARDGRPAVTLTVNDMNQGRMP